MNEKLKVPFFSIMNERCGAYKIQCLVYDKSHQYFLFLFSYLCFLPWTIIYTVYYYLMGFINVNCIKPQINAKYKLGIVAIAKNESEYIAEWMAFCIANGVEHIYLYDNDSTDSMPSIIKKFEKKGYVTYNIIHGEKQQGNAYNDALKRYGKECKYLAFIDCDEYLQTVDSSRTIIEEIERLLGNNNAKAGVVVNWVMYGSSHYLKKPEGMCFEKFTMRANIGRAGTSVIKTIVRPECVLSYSHPHIPKYKVGFYSVNTEGKRIDNWFNDIKEYKSLRLNHYFTKSKEQWVTRRAIKRADTGTTRSIEEFHKHDNNDIIDNSAIIYIDKVKEILKNILG